MECFASANCRSRNLLCRQPQLFAAFWACQRLSAVVAAGCTLCSSSSPHCSSWLCRYPQKLQPTTTCHYNEWGHQLHQDTHRNSRNHKIPDAAIFTTLNPWHGCDLSVCVYYCKEKIPS